MIFEEHRNKVEEVIKLLKQGRSVLVHGEKGVGKSYVVNKVAKQLANNPIGQVAKIEPTNRNLKDFLQELCFQLETGIDEKKIFSSNSTTKDLNDWIRKGVRASDKKAILIIDELPNNLSSKFVSNLIHLFNLGILFLIAPVSLTTNKDLLGKFEHKIEIEPLSVEAAEDYIEHLAEDITVEDVKYLKKGLINKVGCFPKLIKEAIEGFRSEDQITNSMVDEIEYRKPGKTRYMYLPVSAVFIFFLMMNKYMARVTSGGRVHYIIGTFGLVLVIVYRFMVYPYLKKKK